MFSPVYFDHNATTPLDSRVFEAMLPWLSGRGGLTGNPSSRHEYGRQAKSALDLARQQVAEALGAHPSEIIFTSGGTEANNLAIKGMAECRPGQRLLVSAIEHPCVLKPAQQMAKRGWALTPLPVDAQGRIDALLYGQAMASAVEVNPALVSVMLANNETGVVQDIAPLAMAAKASGAWFHSDAVQAFGKIAVDFRSLNRCGVNALTVSAHKIGGPKGVGALVLDKRVELSPLIEGGGQERGLRSGTENIAAIVGFGVACERLMNTQVKSSEMTVSLRDRLEFGLRGMGAMIFGDQSARLPNTSFFAFDGIEGETLVGKLDRAGFAVASGSACSSAQPEPSHVLRSMGVTDILAQGAVRVSLSASNSEQEVDLFLSSLQSTLNQLRTLTAINVAEQKND